MFGQISAHGFGQKRSPSRGTQSHLPARVLLAAAMVAASMWPGQIFADTVPSLRVFASVLPIQYIAQRIGGDNAQVDVMVLPQHSPHTYEPRPRQIAALADAHLYVRVGVTFEDAWMRRIQAANPQMEILDLRDGLDLRPLEAHHHDDDAHNHDHGHRRHGHGYGRKQEAPALASQHAELDPHVWTSPPLVRQMAERLREHFSALDPDHAQAYAERQRAFDQELQALDAELTERLQGVEQRAFLVYHPAWGYFADAYGLRQIPVELQGKEPGARQLTALIEQARALDIRVVLVQPQFDQRAAQQVAQAINGRVASVDPLSVEYAENLRALADLIAGTTLELNEQTDEQPDKQPDEKPDEQPDEHPDEKPNEQPDEQTGERPDAN